MNRTLTLPFVLPDVAVGLLFSANIVTIMGAKSTRLIFYDQSQLRLISAVLQSHNLDRRKEPRHENTITNIVA